VSASDLRTRPLSIVNIRGKRPGCGLLGALLVDEPDSLRLACARDKGTALADRKHQLARTQPTLVARKRLPHGGGADQLVTMTLLSCMATICAVPTTAGSYDLTFIKLVRTTLRAADLVECLAEVGG
jgi:hypothetical protein